MKRSILFATLVLAFGFAIGCSDGKKSAAAPAAPPTNPPPANGCPGGTAWDGLACVVAQGTDLQLYSNLNITNNKKWANFLDDYFFMTHQQVCSVSFYKDILYWFFVGGVKDCETYTHDRTITLNLSSLLISDNGGTSGSLVLTASSSYSFGYAAVYPVLLPVSSPSVTVSRIAVNDVPDSGFQLQMTLSGRNGPKIFRLRGNSIDLVSTNGAAVELYYGDPGDLQKMGSASLFFD